MKMLLKAHKLWKVIEEEEQQSEEGITIKVKRDVKWKKKDQLALSNIVLAVKPLEQEHIYNCQTAWEA